MFQINKLADEDQIRFFVCHSKFPEVVLMLSLWSSGNWGSLTVHGRMSRKILVRGEPSSMLDLLLVTGYSEQELEKTFTESFDRLRKKN